MTVVSFIVSGHEPREETLERLISAFEAMNETHGFGFYIGDEAVNPISITVPFLSQTNPSIGVQADFNTEFGFVTLSFAARDGSRPDAVISELDRRIGFATDEDLLSELERDRTPRALLRFSRGYRGPESNQAAALIIESLSDPAPTSRRTAAMACLNLGWPVLKKELYAAFRGETDPVVRIYMEKALEGLAESGSDD